MRDIYPEEIDNFVVAFHRDTPLGRSTHWEYLSAGGKLQMQGSMFYIPLACLIPKDAYRWFCSCMTNSGYAVLGSMKIMDHELYREPHAAHFQRPRIGPEELLERIRRYSVRGVSRDSMMHPLVYDYSGSTMTRTGMSMCSPPEPFYDEPAKVKGKKLKELNESLFNVKLLTLKYDD